MSSSPRKAVVIGASAGGVEALSSLLPHLPPDYCPVLVVIHLPPTKSSVLADLFHDKCRMRVVEAEDKAPIEAGTIYFAPPDYHLMVETDFTVALSNEAPVWFSRPSIDVLFETAADAYGAGLTGLILTGANEDGAAGLRRVMAQGGRGLIQSPETAYARLMPETALSLCPKALVRPLDRLAAELITEAA
ncbi:chemotaxis protein CheB [Asticcacaulis sp. DW145]|uniref:protein-glutamate methylesterase n=1 Tax=Asticcacaulis currens TaxID=2984210 RepID=A0ABT5ICZ4_9CAUL|nr:chemotaxis protein CheB [Asticcacaulis currens]MDC7694053.1 chemotaxis protein CheB [Asticcacaulis currens]BEV10000.1 chemotaxis protein CheB [Asticcacaulis sp. DW145]